MTYKVTPFTGELTLESLQRYVEGEFDKVTRDNAETSEVELRPIYAEPTKPREGMLVYADGTTWNPGGGKGVYVYNGSGWTKL